MEKEQLLSGWPEHWGTPRDFQITAVERFFSSNQKNFLLAAVPGAGKTKTATYIAKRLKDDPSNSISKVIVVTPTNYLREQWEEVTNEIGLKLDTLKKGGADEREFDGRIVTYMLVASQWNDIQKECRRSPTFVIFDEIHHAGQYLAWGNGLVNAFGGTPRRLSLSGTPWRTRNLITPEFIEYEERIGRKPPKPRTDFPYGYEFDYKAAVNEDRPVCRKVAFYDMSGRVTCRDKHKDGSVTYETLSFDDELTNEKAQKRIRQAVTVAEDGKGGWVSKILTDANNKLMELRRVSDPDAAGIVVTFGHKNAHDIANWMRDNICGGIRPFVVTHKDDQEGNGAKSIDIIEKFRTRPYPESPWIVAVRMISEGVDIDRLRVCAYLTDMTRSRLGFCQICGRVFRFHQGVGRIARIPPDAPDPSPSSFVFMPSDPNLLEHARELIQMQDDAFAEYIAKDKSNGTKTRPDASSTTVDGESKARGITVAGVWYSEEEYREAERYANHWGYHDPLDVARFAEMLRANVKFPDLPEDEREPSSAATREPTLRDQMNHIKRKTRAVIPQIHDVLGVEYRIINDMLNASVGVYNIDQCNLEQLNQRLRNAERWLEFGEPPDGQR